MEKKNSMPSQPKRWVVVHDLHFPLVDWPAWNAVMELVADIKPQGFLFGGDQFDNANISHWNSNKPLYKERRSYLKDQEDFETKILSPLERVLPKGCTKVWIEGNHDFWSWEFVETHPELEGLMDRPTSLKLEKKGWEVIPLGHSYKIGELVVVHGEVLTGIGNQAGMYPARKAVELYSTNVLAGHTHAPQAFTKVSPVDAKKKHMGWINGCMCTTNPAYLKNRPTAYLVAFTVVEVHPNGFFNNYLIVVSNGKFSYGGKLYGKQK